MNKYISILVVYLACHCSIAIAQPWMPPAGTGPVKLQDIIAAHKAELKQNGVRYAKEEEEEGKVVKEGGDYLFDRWAWNMSQHLDAQGYIISPVKTYEEWKKYQDQHHTAQRTTSGIPAWAFQGPDSTPGGYSGIGRVNKIALHPTDPNTLYAGTAGGGPWKTTNGGLSWAPMYANLPTLGVSDIVVNPLNPNTIYVCTGDADGYDNYSMGVVKTLDGGVTWNSTGLLWVPTDYNRARSMVMNPLDTNTLILATGSGIQVSHDAGATWTVAQTGDFNQVIYNPSDTAILYACRYPSGGSGVSASSQIMRSTNGGNTWSLVTTFTGAQRINLAVCPANPALVDALASNNQSGFKGFYTSTNNGASFSPVYEDDSTCTKNIIGYGLSLPTTECNGQGWYDLCLAIDPTNSNKVIVGGVNNFYTLDGGHTWSLSTEWYGAGLAPTVHADKHCLIYNHLDGKLYEGCDGGVYKAASPFTAWTCISNTLAVTEFYRIAIDGGVPFAIGGAQDNGTKMVNGGYGDLTGGDGMLCRIDYQQPDLVWYTSSQYGSINQTDNGGATYHNISNSVPDTMQGDWITPYLLHPIISGTILLGKDMLFVSYDAGASWAPISPIFAVGYNIRDIAMTAQNPNYIYIVLDDNTVRFSPDFGAHWTLFSGSYSNSISRLIVDPHNPDLIWLTFSGYGTNKVASYNRVTHAWGWHNGTLPDVPVNSMEIDTLTNTQYLATDVAVFYKDTTMTDWALYNNNLPSVSVTDIHINYMTQELWAGTYGRGIWKTIKHDVVNEVSVVPFASNRVSVSPNPSRGSFKISTTSSQLMGADVTIRMISAVGRVMWEDKGSFDNSGNLKVTTKGLPAGVYILELSSEKLTTRQRVVVY